MTSYLDALQSALPAFVPVLVYLLAVCACLAAMSRVPEKTHLLALLVGIPAQVVVTGWGSALTTAMGAGVAFVLLVGMAGRTVSGVTIFTLSTAMAIAPPAGWLGLVLALAMAAIVALRRTLTAAGAGRVAWLMMDTAESLGAAPGGKIRRPSVQHVPTRESIVEADRRRANEAADGPQDDATTAPTPSKPMYVPPYLLAGVTGALLFAATLGA